ncbi:sensor domain-containing phosphodiesterase [Marinimicrobium sp. C2-29]|uniref:sensor domain-containing phosphodiesterase n=1 Tax=Marinimicrobium sp. C2-29 TaxID=3139825 RepID=UPI003139F022
MIDFHNHNGQQASSADQTATSANIDPGTTINQLLPSLLEAVRFNLEMDVGFISRFKNGFREFLHVSSEGLQAAPVPGDSDPLDESACIRVVSNQAPKLVHDAQTHPTLMDLPAIRALGVRTHMSVPIPSGNGDVFGTLCCYSSHYREAMDERDIGFMSVIADLIGATLQKEQRVLDDISDRRDYIRNVLNSDGLQMAWQPIVNSITGNIVAVEALARFQTDPYRPPNEWFDEAVKLGIGTELEKSAFAKGMAIGEHLPKNIYVGCNLSGTTFIEPTFQTFLKQQSLEQTVLEITEHDVIVDYDSLTSSLSGFRNQGLRLAIDDFGDGYAGFRHIVELNPDTIKLDMSLVRNINHNPTIQAVVKALVGFAEDRNTQLLAEGVETQAELDTLRSLGIRLVQGYLFYRPMPQSQLLELFHST